ncbi:MAG: plasmid recombination protein [Ruminococcus flavefaciens]|nr:plasmid recombination protein [Ruminococcus flavefaciens]
MAHIEKYNKSAVGRMFDYYARVNKTYSNECIDHERTNLTNHGMLQIDFLNQYDRSQKQLTNSREIKNRNSQKRNGNRTVAPKSNIRIE